MKYYGPYTRKDGRKHLIIVLDNGRRTSISYPRYLLQEYLGRELTEEETVDHIDGNFTNDDISNLQILSRPSNAAKYFNDKSNLRSRYLDIECFYCGKVFKRKEKDHRRALKKNVRSGFFCSRSCQGKVYN